MNKEMDNKFFDDLLEDDGPAVLMRAHGDTVVGNSIQQAVQRTIRLARVGELSHLALLIP